MAFQPVFALPFEPASIIDVGLRNKQQLLHLQQVVAQTDDGQTEHRSLIQQRELHQLHWLQNHYAIGNRPRNTLSRQQKHDIRLLHDQGFTDQQIANTVGVTNNQVDLILWGHLYNPLPRSERPLLLNSPAFKRVISLITSSKEGRRMDLAQAAKTLGLDCPESVIRTALRRAGYSRHPALIRPPITEEIRKLRLAFAQEHVNWTIDQWKNVMWAAENYFLAGKYARVWATRKSDEACDPNCVVETPSKQGCMLWASFSGLKGKGPCVAWDSAWGQIEDVSYYSRVFPATCDWLDAHPTTIRFFNDQVADHAAVATREELKGRRIQTIECPPSSPDLNLMSSIWEKLRESIETPGAEEKPEVFIRMTLQRAWKRLDNEFLNNLLHSMKDRCKAVISANGKYTRYY
ncbi:transposable element tc1 transposase [Fusarium albosuccineum]|uniref:Transposable element tc1 transposase n=1 Tax=Fusarium albosuccineum TaxID=1237068 RepID=A0A8H4LJF8_9HYPO|nr:transposable element tc1 transposase [Fusarium albosuccineum]